MRLFDLQNVFSFNSLLSVEQHHCTIYYSTVFARVSRHYFVLPPSWALFGTGYLRAISEIRIVQFNWL